ncbi:SCP2 sterol-binding domain-containing protein [Zavarzinia aquatilis]|uniref:Sterol-binding protein n=1 Tax=Zavarzinia aquatilis TaxID=2211142 RepID=A0A317DSD3_9PROT|nr:SCP2 sterol-binding domain-containing protein [Zavarzinia aquatilis]PWR17579.1 sterol-binding protein [Zavarzinia aquatilis]
MSDDDVEEIRSEVAQRLGEDFGLNATLKLDFNGAGIVYLDGRATPNAVSGDDLPADCTIRISLADFRAMTEGRLDGTTAFMMGRLKVEGQTAIAMKLRPILGRK